jgi:hypothetical protein
LTNVVSGLLNKHMNRVMAALGGRSRDDRKSEVNRP